MNVFYTEDGLMISTSLLSKPSYYFNVCSARKFLRKRDFLHYGSQLVPEKLGSETWSMAWAYIREIDDVIDRNISCDKQLAILSREWSMYKDILNGNGLKVHGERVYVRHLWMTQFLENLFKYYNSDEQKIVLDSIEKLYRSAVLDAKRKGKVLPLHKLLYLTRLKAVYFFKIFFILGRLNLNHYMDKISEFLGMGLGLLDDLIDLIYDWKIKYINISLEELRSAGLNINDEKLLSKILLNRNIFWKKSLQILKILLLARILALKVRDPIARNLVLRLTEVFAAPILQGKPIPGSTYLFRGGKILMKILPRDEMKAYEIGHKIVKKVLAIPQISPMLIKLWIKLSDRFP